MGREKNSEHIRLKQLAAERPRSNDYSLDCRTSSEPINYLATEVPSQNAVNNVLRNRLNVRRLIFRKDIRLYLRYSEARMKRVKQTVRSRGHLQCESPIRCEERRTFWLSSHLTLSNEHIKGNLLLSSLFYFIRDA